MSVFRVSPVIGSFAQVGRAAGAGAPHPLCVFITLKVHLEINLLQTFCISTFLVYLFIVLFYDDYLMTVKKYIHEHIVLCNTETLRPSRRVVGGHQRELDFPR